MSTDTKLTATQVLMKMQTDDSLSKAMDAIAKQRAALLEALVASANSYAIISGDHVVLDIHGFGGVVTRREF